MDMERANNVKCLLFCIEESRPYLEHISINALKFSMCKLSQPTYAILFNAPYSIALLDSYRNLDYA